MIFAVPSTSHHIPRSPALGVPMNRVRMMDSESGTYRGLTIPLGGTAIKLNVGGVDGHALPMSGSMAQVSGGCEATIFRDMPMRQGRRIRLNGSMGRQVCRLDPDRIDLSRYQARPHIHFIRPRHCGRCTKRQPRRR